MVLGNVGVESSRAGVFDVEVEIKLNDFELDRETLMFVPKRFLAVSLANRVADWAMEFLRLVG